MLSPPERRRSLYRLHSAFGVAFGVWLFAVAFTGSVSIFRAELDTWSQPGFTGTPGVPRGSADRALAGAGGAIAGATSVMMRFPSEASAAWDILAGAPGRAPLRVRVDPATGSAIGPARHDAATVYFRLHAYMLLPGKVGRWLVGVLGMALLGSAFTGVFMHRNVWRSAAHLRFGKRLRIVAADLHRALGLWALLFHVLMGTTGAYLGLKDLLLAPALLARFDGDLAAGRQAISSVRAQRTGVPAPLIELEPLVEQARIAIPDLEPAAIRLDHPGDAGARVTVLGTLPGHLVPELEAETVEFDGVTGARLDVFDAARGSVPLRVYFALSPLHFATFGGVGVRFLYFALGLSTALLAASGAVIFRERRLRTGAGAGPRGDGEESDGLLRD